MAQSQTHAIVLRSGQTIGATKAQAQAITAILGERDSRAHSLNNAAFYNDESLLVLLAEVVAVAPAA